MIEPAICQCGRQALGFYYQKKTSDRKHWCCSMGCLDVVHSLRGIMTDPTELEIAALIAASTPAGEYIESLGSTDMATWTEDEWMAFLECVVTAYTDAMRQPKHTPRTHIPEDQVPY